MIPIVVVLGLLAFAAMWIGSYKVVEVILTGIVVFMGVVFFGPRALVATIISVLACEFFEWGYRKLMHKSCAVKDLSAAVTGVLLAFVCAPTCPIGC